MCSSRDKVNVTVRRGLHGSDEGRAGRIAVETVEFFGRNDNDFIAATDGDALWAFGADAAHQFAETSLGVLQQPEAWLRSARGLRALRSFGR